MDDMAASTGSPSSSPSFIFFFFLFFSFLLISTAEDTITPTKFITGGQTLISPGKIFELGFFSLNNSSNHFLGIWYHHIPVRTYVWVANGDRPLSDSSGVFTIQEDRGGLILLDGKQALVWSTNASVTTKNSTSAKLLDSGNLVLITAGNSNSSEGILWQSFDHPSNTLLPGMKIGLKRSTQQNSMLVSWKTDTNPSPGSFSYGLDPQDSYQFFIWNNSVPYWRSGYWNGRTFNLVPEASIDFIFHFNVISNEEEASFEYSALYNNTRLVMDVSGQLTCLVWYDSTQVWGPVWSAPKDPCSYYGVCGFNSICSDFKMPKCKCLPGFEPDSPKDWNSGNWVNGCKRRKRFECVEKDEFLALGRMKVPDREIAVEADSAEVCRDGCRKNCSCIAYVYANDSNNGGSGCLVWHGNLTDVGDLKVVYGSQDLYIRSAGLEPGQGKKKLVLIIVSTTVCTSILIVGIVLYCSWRRKVKKEGNNGRILNTLSFNSSDSAPILKGTLVADKDGEESIDIPFFSFRSVLAATDNFSDSNLLGEGGFGRVYKGKLLGGQEIAVKRLSSTSGQGQEEFKNEVMLIAKLQHRNLVRLLGYCIETDERILLYEYMPNKSLDFFIFDPNRSKLLNWEGRFNIILGIARGLLYLHQDSRLRIIHRDLKTSNILLDEEMNPKISDFGMARIFVGNETQGNTKRIVGTYGYMSPEYALDGLFSVKSDVFSFGVIVLEIISGKKNNGFYHYEDSLSLLVYAWKLWTEDKALELIDSSLGELTDECDVLKCFQIGLLCVQENPADRPTMASVVADLGSENAALPMPRQPASYVRKHLMEEQLSKNEVTVTVFEGR